MTGRAAPDETEISELLRQCYYALPTEERTAINVLRRFEALRTHHKPPKYRTVSTMMRVWKSHTPVEEAAELLLPHSLPSQEELASRRGRELVGIPKELSNIVGARVAFIGKGEGLDKIEDACARVAGHITAKAEQVVKLLLDDRPDARAGMVIINALRELASAMEMITASRTMLSLGHKQFAEGDLSVAQALATMEKDRHLRAQEINGGTNGEDRAAPEEEEHAYDVLSRMANR